MGIDYGHGRTNRDPATGFRFGILPLSSLPDWFLDECEQEYLPACPECGSDDLQELRNERKRCRDCRYTANEDYFIPEEPNATNFDVDGVQGFVDRENDVWITRSPWIAQCQFCSPCAPGAGYLISAAKDCWAFAPDPSWFGEDAEIVSRILARATPQEGA